MKIKIMVFAGVILAFVLFLFISIKVSFYVQSAHLCELIKNGETTKSLEKIERMNSINEYSAPLGLDWFFNVGGETIKLPLVEACRYGDYDVVVALLNKGADPNKYIDGSRSPIEASFVNANENRFEIAQELIGNGCDVNLCGSATPALFLELNRLMYSESADAEQLRIAEQSILLLMENGASLYDDKENSVVHYLCFAGELDLLKTTIDKFPLQLDYKNNKGQTPLMWAIEGGEIQSVKFLIDAKVDIYAQDNQGKTALDYAKENNNTEIIELLTR